VEERGLRRFYRDESRDGQKLFCQYVGAWIDSGFQPDGSEERERRTYATWGGQVIFQSLGRLLNSFDVIEGPPAQTIFGLQARNSKHTPLLGSLRIWFDPKGGIRADPVVFRGYLEAKELAAYGFFLFWQSQWLFTIMRCANCGKFDIPERKPRSSYIRGWHCEVCRNSASAKAATADARKSMRNRWFELAISASREYDRRSRRSGNDRVRFVTTRVNRDLPALQRIKRNTISRNLAKIQAEAGRRENNAKG
jgi:hypothetical protein